MMSILRCTLLYIIGVTDDAASVITPVMLDSGWKNRVNSVPHPTEPADYRLNFNSSVMITFS